LFFTLRGDVHTGHYRIKTTEFQARDQTVKGRAGEGTGRIDLFTQRICQVDVKANDLVVCICGFKRRVAGFGSETNSLGSTSREADAGEQGGNQYFFHCHGPEKISEISSV